MYYPPPKEDRSWALQYTRTTYDVWTKAYICEADHKLVDGSRFCKLSPPTHPSFPLSLCLPPSPSTPRLLPGNRADTVGCNTDAIRMHQGSNRNALITQTHDNPCILHLSTRTITFRLTYLYVMLARPSLTPPPLPPPPPPLSSCLSFLSHTYQCCSHSGRHARVEQTCSKLLGFPLLFWG